MRRSLRVKFIVLMVAGLANLASHSGMLRSPLTANKLSFMQYKHPDHMYRPNEFLLITNVF